MKQTADLRNPPPWGDFGTEEDLDRACERYDEARARMTVPYQVAPGCKVELPGGRVLAEGDEVKPGDFAGVDQESGRVKLARLVNDGKVIEWNGAPVASSSAPYIVAAGGAITTTRGIRGPGEEVLVTDFAGEDLATKQVSLDRLVERGLVIKS